MLTLISFCRWNITFFCQLIIENFLRRRSKKKKYLNWRKRLYEPDSLSDLALRMSNHFSELIPLSLSPSLPLLRECAMEKRESVGNQTSAWKREREVLVTAVCCQVSVGWESSEGKGLLRASTRAKLHFFHFRPKKNYLSRSSVCFFGCFFPKNPSRGEPT